MGIPELIKSPYALGGLGAAGTGAVGVAGWQYLTSNTEDIGKTSIPVDLFQESTNQGYRGCDSLLFGSDSSSGIGYAPDSTAGATWTDGNVFQSESITSTSTGNTLGCISISINANPTSEQNYLSMKLSFKNDGIGWFLRSTMEEDASSSDKYSLTHHLFLLNKESHDWKVKKGFAWKDSELKLLSSGNKVKVKIPGQAESEITIGTDPGSKSTFVGVWESSSEEGKKGILEDLGLTKESDSKKSDILGRTGEALKQEVINVDEVYDITSSSPGKWKKVDTSITKNIKDVISKWYEPFENEKGSWTKGEEYCKKDTKDRKIQGLCTSSSK